MRLLAIYVLGLIVSWSFLIAVGYTSYSVVSWMLRAFFGETGQ